MSERSTVSKLLSIHFAQPAQNFSITISDVFYSRGKEGLSICPRLWWQGWTLFLLHLTPTLRMSSCFQNQKWQGLWHVFKRSSHLVDE